MVFSNKWLSILDLVETENKKEMQAKTELNIKKFLIVDTKKSASRWNCPLAINKIRKQRKRINKQDPTDCEIFIPITVQFKVKDTC